MGRFFLGEAGGAEASLPEKFFDGARKKTAMLTTCKITLPDSPHPVIISKNPGFRAIYLARQNEFRFFV